MNNNIFRKLSFQGNEIEIFEKNEESYFDKYLNEVLYLFENCGADAIVFEDLDRYEANRIFVRLKEINLLVNTKREASDKGIHPLRFIYLVRDDIFTSKDRTKFFDFIIPIVPVVDGSNSYDLFRKYLENNNILDKFDQGFLSAVSLYVDEMRILKNICNEFIIYYNTLSVDNLMPNYNKLMAMILYKNLFPKDFNDLQLRQGYVYWLFETKPRHIENERNIIDSKIEQNKEDTQKAKCELLQSTTELNYVDKGYERDMSHSEYARWKKEEYPIRKSILEKCAENEVKHLEKELKLLNYKRSKLDAIFFAQIIPNDNIIYVFGLGFIDEYLSTTKVMNNFVVQMNKLWSKFFSEAIISKGLSPKKLHQYFIDTLYYSSENDILNVNSDNIITNYISSNRDYLNIISPKINKLLNGFKLLNVEFKSIDFEVSNKDLFNKVYNYGLYELNSENISLMLSKACMIESEDDIHYKPSELILQRHDSSLYKKYKNDPQKYLEIILSYCENIINDNEDTIVTILNNEEIDSDLKVRYIKCIT